MERTKALTTEAVEKQFPEAMDALKDWYGIRWVKRCACGAITFEGDRGIGYSVMPGVKVINFTFTPRLSMLSSAF